jgi:hypothetical protein
MPKRSKFVGVPPGEENNEIEKLKTVSEEKTAEKVNKKA